jgi:hypothetical protein
VRVLIFSSFTDFSSISPQHSRQIIEQLQSLSSLVEVETIFVYGLLDDQFTSKNHFRLVLGWGHTSTVKLLLLLLKCRTDILANSCALIFASEKGQISILQRHTDIPDFLVGEALWGQSNAVTFPLSNFFPKPH